MATITQIRTGIATNLSSISGLRVTETQPDNPQPPTAVIQPSSIDFDQTFKRGLDIYNFVITVIVGRASERHAQNLLDSYCTSGGATSVKAAIESNRTLSGIVDDLRVTAMRNYGTITIGEVIYLAAEFDLVVYTQ